MKNEYKMGGRGPCLIPTEPIFQKHYFFEVFRQHFIMKKKLSLVRTLHAKNSQTHHFLEQCIPLKSPIEWLPKMQKKLNFQLLLGFRGHFQKSGAFEKRVR